MTAAAVVAGCATAPTTVTTTALAFRPVQAYFSISGRLAAKNGEDALSGKFAWQHAPASDRWDFYSPLGQLVARLTRNGETATLVTSNGEQIVEPVETLIARVLGVAVPVASLPRWVQGGVVAREDVREQDAVGRPLRIADDGWQVRYLAYASDAPDARPRSIEVSRGEARLKLIVDQWQ
ncbi:outer membrane lipoprotein LolB [Nitrogeniibacter mangrovi]|uniref:Outer-membrane lipoprotein LolB n=1 Tax=Nitrogeniibacter mangrovi TaxID=2016596 RepID=A0A6C1B7U3_9RHOO|nr:lipoprotein insertase outer membrane protein LolB [Nitrogeniibacter mangrovi]QID18885.1 outer membrane lipoprotein LolB [Nitrogeniibacter mangrovi]